MTTTATWTGPEIAAAIRGFLKASARKQHLDTGTAVELLSSARDFLASLPPLPPPALAAAPELAEVLGNLADEVDSDPDGVSLVVAMQAARSSLAKVRSALPLGAAPTYTNPYPNRVVLTVEGGIVQAVNADRPADVQVTVLDFDVESDDHPTVHHITDALGHDNVLVGVDLPVAEPFSPGLAGVLQQIAEQNEEADEQAPRCPHGHAPDDACLDCAAEASNAQAPRAGASESRCSCGHKQSSHAGPTHHGPCHGCDACNQFTFAGRMP